MLEDSKVTEEQLTCKSKYTDLLLSSVSPTSKGDKWLTDCQNPGEKSYITIIVHSRFQEQNQMLFLPIFTFYNTCYARENRTPVPFRY